MVLPLRPSKFYGSSLPRPRIYSDLKFNSERVDPPMGVTTPLMSWAMDAHWSMGGLCLKRKRMAGKIEGNVKKLREEDEKDARKKISAERKKKKEEKENSLVKADSGTGSLKKKALSPVPSAADSSPPEAQLIKQKWAKEHDLEDEDCPTVVPLSIENSGRKSSTLVRRRIRKLGEVFNQQAVSSPNGRSNVSSDLGVESLKVASVSRSASKKELRKEAQVYDYVAVPDKIIKATPKRGRNENLSGIEPGSPVSPVRRSNRFAASTPLAPIKKGTRRNAVAASP